MQTAKELSEVLNKIRPLQEETKAKKRELLSQLLKKRKTDQTVEVDGRCFKVKQSLSKPPLSKKMLSEMVQRYGEPHGQVLSDFVSFVESERNSLKKVPKFSLSITTSEPK